MVAAVSPRPIERHERNTLSVRRPAPGVTMLRFAGERPLMRVVPEHYGSTLHLDGQSRWTSGGAQWSSAPGGLSVKVPGEAAVEQAREGELAFQVVLFDAHVVDEARRTLERPLVLSHMRDVDRRDPRSRPLVALHRHLLEGATDAEIEGAVCDALHALVDVVSAQSDAKVDRWGKRTAAVARAQSLLDARFTETVGLDELALHARLDKFRLCRAFREEIGLPPHAYVTHRRVARAQQLLARGMTQAEVAANVGFYDQSLLHRHFKRILRITPGDFVRAVASA